jgi:large subunit ribosomal protein L15
MKYNELILTKQQPANRSGRGISAGRGKTAGRGTKGQGARKSTPRPGFEGGQMPIYMRLPKLRGFKSHRRTAENVYTGQLETIKKTRIDNQTLFEAGLVSSPNCSVKLLVKGDVISKKDVHLQMASKNAVAAIEKAGGSFSQTAQVGRSSKKAAKPAEE